MVTAASAVHPVEAQSESLPDREYLCSRIPA
jgi:hypothetical protein